MLLLGILTFSPWPAPLGGAPKVLPLQTLTIAAPLAAPRDAPSPQAPKPIAKFVAKPTPKPDPLREARIANEIPDWAKGRVLHKVPVKPGEKVIALTFDDGPSSRYTQQIINILAAYDAKATFYMVGQEVSANSKTARLVRDRGHAIGNHSWDHPSRPRDPAAQVRRTDQAIRKAVGIAPATFRPPYGMLRNGLAAQAMKQKHCVVIWSADSNDWKRLSSERIARTIIRQAGPGGIALLHDGGGNRSRTVAALPIILRTLRGRGYRFVTVPELLRMRYVAPRKAKKKKVAKSTLGAKKTTKPLASRKKIASR